MMTSARPIAMRRSRVQMRISFLREWWEWLGELEGECSDAAPEFVAGAPDSVPPVSPPPVTEGCRSSVLSILCCLVFITRPRFTAPPMPCHQTLRGGVRCPPVCAGVLNCPTRNSEKPKLR